MKKFLSVFALATFLAASVAAAPAVLPHVHGSDVDHSSHSSCPVHLAGSHSPADLATFVSLFIFLTVALAAVVFLSFSVSRLQPRALYRRAPPVSVS